MLDESATASVTALHIPPPPQALNWREREISLPIRYALDWIPGRREIRRAELWFDDPDEGEVHAEDYIEQVNRLFTGIVGFAAALVRGGRDPATLRGLADLVDPAAVRAGLRALMAGAGGQQAPILAAAGVRLEPATSVHSVSGYS